MRGRAPLWLPLIAVWALACRTPEVPAPPNLLLVVVDALRADHLGCYGYPLPTSPNIDRLARESVVFDQAFAHSTWTKPSVATLLTSLYPSRHGLGRMAVETDAGHRAEVLSRRHLTLAEQLAKHGYATGAFGANVHLQRKTGFAQGFDRFESVRLLTASELDGRWRAWLATGVAEPWAAYLHLMDAHWPYDRYLPLAEAEAASPGVNPFGDPTLAPEPPESWQAVAGWAERHLDAANLAALRARYDAEIAFLDAAMGELLAWLAERGLAERTVVVLTADHGEGFYEHGQLQHSFRPYEEVSRVPLLVRTPTAFGIRPGRVAEPVGLVDLAPTLLKLAGAPPLPDAAGVSLVP
ncbi:MAG: sulfatase, partial [Thermoanaerobaculia bacterium]